MDHLRGWAKEKADLDWEKGLLNTMEEYTLWCKHNFFSTTWVPQRSMYDRLLLVSQENDLEKTVKIFEGLYKLNESYEDKVSDENFNRVFLRHVHHPQWLPMLRMTRSTTELIGAVKRLLLETQLDIVRQRNDRSVRNDRPNRRGWSRGGKSFNQRKNFQYGNHNPRGDRRNEGLSASGQYHNNQRTFVGKTNEKTQFHNFRANKGKFDVERGAWDLTDQDESLKG